MTDAVGRSISLSYDSAGRLTMVTDSEHATISYDYDASGNLNRVAWPDGKFRTYDYEDTLRAFLLTGITDESLQRVSTYSYDSSGRVFQTQRTTGANRHSFTYGSPLSTTVDDPLNATSSIIFAHSAGGVLRPTSWNQPGGAGCGPSSSAITYDANANVASRTDFNNTKSCYANDLSRNLETARVEGFVGSDACPADVAGFNPVANTPQRKILTQWHPEWRLEARRSEPKRITTTVYNGQVDPTSGSNTPVACAPADALVDGKPIAVVCRRIEQATSDETGALGFAAPAVGPGCTNAPQREESAHESDRGGPSMDAAGGSIGWRLGICLKEFSRTG